MVAFRRVETTAKVAILGVSLGETPLTNIACLNCRQEMEIHQPDGGFPERMLGTCSNCREWFLWDFDAGTSEAVVVLLPDRDYFKKATGGAGA